MPDRPTTPAEAVYAAERVLAAAEEHLAAKRDAWQHEQDQRDASERTEAAEWAALPLDQRLAAKVSGATDRRLNELQPSALTELEAARAQAKAEAEEQRASAKAAAKAARDAWIAEHGSERLKLALQNGQADACLKSYLLERLALEMPGWRLRSGANGIDDEEDISEPTKTALRALEVANADLRLRPVSLVWLTTDSQAERDEDGEYTGETIPATGCEALAADYLGKRIVLDIEGGRSK